MKFCSHCGSNVSLRTPNDDNRPRFICDDCGIIHYQNPNIIAGCIPEWGDKVLLCKRAIEPYKGKWTLPAGFMENLETVEQAAQRETLEEAEAEVEITGLCAVYSIPHISQVYMLFHGPIKDGYFSPGPESLETALYAEKEIPWNDLAFPVITRTLKTYFDDRRKGKITLQRGMIKPRPAE